MTHRDVPDIRYTEFASALERHIDKQTWGRLRNLRVEVCKDRVLVHGWTSSYYLKQRALTAVLAVVSNMPQAPHLTMNIEVGTGAPAGERRLRVRA